MLAPFQSSRTHCLHFVMDVELKNETINEGKKNEDVLTTAKPLLVLSLFIHIGRGF